MDYQVVEVVVRVKIKDGYDVSDVISDMDYDFKHEAILDTEIVDVNNEI